MKDLAREARTMLEITARLDAAPDAIRQRARKRLVESLAAGTVGTSAVVAKGAGLVSPGASAATAVVGAGISAGTSSLVTAMASAILVGLSVGLVVTSPASRSSEPTQIPSRQIQVSLAGNHPSSPHHAGMQKVPMYPTPVPRAQMPEVHQTETSTVVVPGDGVTLRAPPSSTEIQASARPWHASPPVGAERSAPPTQSNSDAARSANMAIESAVAPDAQGTAPSSVLATEQPSMAPIAREIALLGEVQRLIAAQNARLALAALRRYADEFPHGALREEAAASRIVALCALGHVAEGQNMASTFRQRYPDSPLLKRVQSACPAGRGVTAVQPQ